jgi:hypothetical protein
MSSFPALQPYESRSKRGTSRLVDRHGLLFAACGLMPLLVQERQDTSAVPSIEIVAEGTLPSPAMDALRVTLHSEAQM